jgi:hypothetical protein
VNLRPPSVSFGSLVFLWLAVSLSCRLGAPTWAEIAKLDNPQAWGIGGGLVTLFILGALLFIGLLMAYVNLARPVATPPRAVTPEPVRMATEIVTGFRPNMVFVPWGHGLTKTLHISGEQLEELQARIGSEQLGLPVNGMQTFTSAGMKNFRREAVAQELAIWEGRNKNIAHLTEEGAAALLRSSPALAVSARVRANVRDTNAYNG